MSHLPIQLGPLPTAHANIQINKHRWVNVSCQLIVRWYSKEINLNNYKHQLSQLVSEIILSRNSHDSKLLKKQNHCYIRQKWSRTVFLPVILNRFKRRSVLQTWGTQMFLCEGWGEVKITLLEERRQVFWVHI